MYKKEYKSNYLFWFIINFTLAKVIFISKSKQKGKSRTPNRTFVFLKKKPAPYNYKTKLESNMILIEANISVLTTVFQGTVILYQQSDQKTCWQILIPYIHRTLPIQYWWCILCMEIGRPSISLHIPISPCNKRLNQFLEISKGFIPIFTPLPSTVDCTI